MTRDKEQKTVLLKFGSFYLTAESEIDDGRPSTIDRPAKATHEVLLTGAKTSPLVTHIIDEGAADASWWADVDEGDKRGVASGLLMEVVFEARWPTRNWRGFSTHKPDHFILGVNGLTYGVLATVEDEPFEDSFELGRQAQACLEAIYSSQEGYFIHFIGPTPMWPAFYLTNRDGPAVSMIGENDVLLRGLSGELAATANSDDF